MNTRNPESSTNFDQQKQPETKQSDENIDLEDIDLRERTLEELFETEILIIRKYPPKLTEIKKDEILCDEKYGTTRLFHYLSKSEAEKLRTALNGETPLPPSIKTRVVFLELAGHGINKKEESQINKLEKIFTIVFLGTGTIELTEEQDVFLITTLQAIAPYFLKEMKECQQTLASITDINEAKAFIREKLGECQKKYFEQNQTFCCSPKQRRRLQLLERLDKKNQNREITFQSLQFLLEINDPVFFDEIMELRDKMEINKLIELHQKERDGFYDGTDPLSEASARNLLAELYDLIENNQAAQALSRAKERMSKNYLTTRAEESRSVYLSLLAKYQEISDRFLALIDELDDLRTIKEIGEPSEIVGEYRNFTLVKAVVAKEKFPSKVLRAMTKYKNYTFRELEKQEKNLAEQVLALDRKRMAVHRILEHIGKTNFDKGETAVWVDTRAAYYRALLNRVRPPNFTEGFYIDIPPFGSNGFQKKMNEVTIHFLEKILPVTFEGRGQVSGHIERLTSVKIEHGVIKIDLQILYSLKKVND